MRVNDADVDWTTTERGETTFRRKKLAAAAGGERLGCSLYELPPGKKAWPFHYHTGNEEAIYVLAGTGRLRTPDGADPLHPGDYAVFLVGEDGGHRVSNDGDEPLRYGPNYVIPKPLDPRVLFEVAPAVAEAAIESGAARQDLDLDSYSEQLEARLGKGREMMRVVLNKAKADPKRVVLAEGGDEKIIRAAYQLQDEGIAETILIGNTDQIHRRTAELGLAFDPEIVDPTSDHLDPYAERLHDLRKRDGVTRNEADSLIRDGDWLASTLVEMGDADVMLTGLTHHYPTALRPPLQVVGTAPDANYAAGVYMLTFDDRVVFCADATVNQAPDEDVLEEVARHTADLARQFNVDPRVALLSYSDFGTVDNEGTRKPREAADRLRSDPTVDFPVDGEMQADTAVVEDILTADYAFTELDEPANVLVFPNLEAGNIAYKLLQRLGGADAVGPMLVGMDKPVHVLQRGDEVKDIVNLAGVAVVDAQEEE